MEKRLKEFETENKYLKELRTKLRRRCDRCGDWMYPEDLRQLTSQTEGFLYWCQGSECTELEYIKEIQNIPEVRRFLWQRHSAVRAKKKLAVASSKALLIYALEGPAPAKVPWYARLAAWFWWRKLAKEVAERVWE